jgi:transcriptional regulator with XRE-family HTH domain
VEKVFPEGIKTSEAMRKALFQEGLTQNQLSARVGIKVNHILDMERGKRSMGKEMARGQMVEGNKRERQFKRLQKQAERIEKWLQANEARYGTTGKEISCNLTDNESAKMKTTQGVIQGDNGQALAANYHIRFKYRGFRFHDMILRMAVILDADKRLG